MGTMNKEHVCLDYDSRLHALLNDLEKKIFTQALNEYENYEAFLNDEIASNYAKNVTDYYHVLLNYIDKVTNIKPEAI